MPQQWRARLGLSEYAGHTGSTGSNTLYSRLPTYAWGASRLAGLHSTLFDIEANIRDGDQRSGLEPIGAQEIERLMATDGVVSRRVEVGLDRRTDAKSHMQDFDTARLMLNRQRFASNNIDPQTGMPLDRKAVTFENLR